MVQSTAMRQLFCVVWALAFNGFADAFCTVRPGSIARCHQLRPNAGVTIGRKPLLSNSLLRFGERRPNTCSGKTRTFLVSEEDVLEAVERAETLWAEALEARKTANALIDKAAEEAESSAGTAKKAENIFQDKTTPITMQELVQVDSAAKASLDATSLVNRAMEASDQASELEAKAEEALKKSEEALDQHLIDFPDSSLAD